MFLDTIPRSGDLKDYTCKVYKRQTGLLILATNWNEGMQYNQGNPKNDNFSDNDHSDPSQRSGCYPIPGLGLSLLPRDGDR
jgi:hypothetical protein